MTVSSDISRMLQDWSDGDQSVVDELITAVEGELRKQARVFLRNERPNHTLQTSALINEAYLKLVGQRRPRFENRTHFFSFCAHIMRRILVDYARARSRKKRGGNAHIITLDDTVVDSPSGNSVDLIALDQALDRLGDLDSRQARIVELRYFAGMTLDETADSMEISRSLVSQEWAVAKAWLHRELTK